MSHQSEQQLEKTLIEQLQRLARNVAINIEK